MVDTLSKDEIASLTLEKAEEVLQTRQKSMADIFAEAKTDDGKTDFNKVKSLTGVKGSVAVAEYIGQMENEMNEVGKARDSLLAAAQAAKNLADRSQPRGGFTLPGGGSVGGKGNYPSEGERFKSLGEMVTESKDFESWNGGGRNEGKTFKFDDVLPTDYLAKGMNFSTLGSKALMSTSAGWAPENLRAPGFVEAITRPLQLSDIIPMGQTSQAAYSYMEETTRNHNADFTAEGGNYAESEFVFTQKSSPVAKITDSLPVTDEQLEDVAGIESYINLRLPFGIRRKFDATCLIGSGVAPQLRGLKNLVGRQTQAKGVDPVPDAFYKAMTKVQLNGRSMATHNVMHALDWQALRLLRTVDGVYVWGNPSEAGAERLWGLSVVKQDIDAQGTGYTGSFTPDCVSGFERRGVEIAVGYIDKQFTQGLRTIRGDMRVALAWFRPAAFCDVTGL